MTAEEKREAKNAAGRRHYQRHRHEIIARTAAYQKEHREKSNESTRNWARKHPDKVLAKYQRRQEQARDVPSRSPEKRAQYSRKKNYGLTAERFAEMMQAQGGCCAICGEPFTGSPHVDHDHGTRAIRALLCGTCNRGLGNFKDRPELLVRAQAYLALYRR